MRLGGEYWTYDRNNSQNCYFEFKAQQIYNISLLSTHFHIYISCICEKVQMACLQLNYGVLFQLCVRQHLSQTVVSQRIHQLYGKVFHLLPLHWFRSFGGSFYSGKTNITEGIVLKKFLELKRKYYHLKYYKRRVLTFIYISFLALKKIQLYRFGYKNKKINYT